MRAVAEGQARDGDGTLAILNYVTFGALVKRGYLTIDGRHNPVFTDAGLRAYETYRDMEVPHRNQPGAVTDFVASMLGLRLARNGCHKKGSAR